MEMDPTTQKNTETQSPEDENPSSLSNAIVIPPTASISLSLSSVLRIPDHLFTPTKITQLLPPKYVKIPHQISSALSLSSFTVYPPKPFSKKSSFSAIPLQNPLSLNPRLPSEPSNGAALRRAAIVWFRNDLRVHDNECLTTANNESTSVLPLYCFDPRDYGKSSSGFDKTGPYRASFLIQSVSDLRNSLQARGSDLVVRIGKPETVLVEIAKEIGADAVYAHREVSTEEVKSEERVEKALKEEGVDVKYLWGSTLYHLDDLPFKLEDMPTNYGGFRERVQGLNVRDTIAALDQLKGLPSRGDVEPGEIPSLVDLGLNPNVTLRQDGKPAAHASMVGGETEALQRLQKFAAECRAQPPKTKDGTKSIYGANFSCKISPWLAMGCLSPRHMFDELKKTASRTISASNRKDGDDGMNWLMFELLWRDFFRFITAKYSSAKKHVSAAPATACTGALA
uniref:Photolyase/cryptochrome alpha/beta domain-containing protein n=1 Tax=Opuntia streptacantha TaxID=393608 RepID=A0A7C8ZDU8_OPUST